MLVLLWAEVAVDVCPRHVFVERRVIEEPAPEGVGRSIDRSEKGEGGAGDSCKTKEQQAPYH